MKQGPHTVAPWLERLEEEVVVVVVVVTVVVVVSV
jgi:hypothetical protein